jgi:hypothetical protein
MSKLFSLLLLFSEVAFRMTLMKRLALSVAAVAVLVSPARLSYAEDRRSFGFADRRQGEDPSCDLVNRAYERTFNGNLATRIYSVEPNGAADLLETYRLVGSASYDRTSLGTWHKRYRGFQSTVDGIGAVFRNCEFVSHQDYGNIPTQSFRGDWARLGYNASVEVWISEVSGKVIKTVRRFNGKSPHDFPPIVMDIFETRREFIQEPTDFVDLRGAD